MAYENKGRGGITQLLTYKKNDDNYISEMNKHLPTTNTFLLTLHKSH